ncbi:hypothetical protein BH11GEM1_BH11GEM1_12720 [soil metagenome]
MPALRLQLLLTSATALVLGNTPSATAQLAAPAPPPARADSTIIKEYRGAYQRGFEQSWFVPCDGPMDDRMWWVTLTDQALLQRDSLLAKISKDPTNGLAVRWRATVGPRMPAGMMGHGTRYMLVTEIIEVKPLPSAGACQAVERSA